MAISKGDIVNIEYTPTDSVTEDTVEGEVMDLNFVGTAIEYVIETRDEEVYKSRNKKHSDVFMFEDGSWEQIGQVRKVRLA